MDNLGWHYFEETKKTPPLGGYAPAGSLRCFAAPPRIANAILPPGIPQSASAEGRQVFIGRTVRRPATELAAPAPAEPSQGAFRESLAFLVGWRRARGGGGRKWPARARALALERQNGILGLPVPSWRRRPFWLISAATAPPGAKTPIGAAWPRPQDSRTPVKIRGEVSGFWPPLPWRGKGFPPPIRPGVPAVPKTGAGAAQRGTAATIGVLAPGYRSRWNSSSA